ncbi:MAG: hypothetical protein LQ350_003956 [Teloschistes chrysophthalmus]|nr:MAG: hypothetical protein LQ350_003956 [Niorma chrysophthalma]
MAEEPQPPSVHPGHDPTDETPDTDPKAHQETEEAIEPAAPAERKAAAALSSLADQDDTKATTSKIKNIDQDALAKAISRLELSSGVKGGAEPSEAEKRFNEKRRREREEREARGRVKVDVADVGLLVQELDLSKTKAKELLQAHDGNAVKAMRAFVAAPV